MRKLILANLMLVSASLIAPDYAEAQVGQVLRQVCQRNIYGYVSCQVIAQEAYNYGRRAVVNQYRDLRYPPQRYYQPRPYRMQTTTPYMIRRR